MRYNSNNRSSRSRQFFVLLFAVVLLLSDSGGPLARGGGRLGVVAAWSLAGGSGARSPWLNKPTAERYVVIDARVCLCHDCCWIPCTVCWTVDSCFLSCTIPSPSLSVDGFLTSIKPFSRFVHLYFGKQKRQQQHIQQCTPISSPPSSVLLSNIALLFKFTKQQQQPKQ
jgi:hypothetical protein